MSADTQVLLISAMRREEFYAQSPRRRAVGDLGIRYLAAWLRQHGIRADLLPAHQNTEETLAHCLRKAEGLALVGFSLHTSSLESGLEGLAISRRLRPEVPIAVGGYLPTFAADALRAHGAGFDYLLPGEAESALLALARRLLGGTRDIGILGDHASGGGQDLRRPTGLGGPGALVALDELPWPLRTPTDMPRDTAEIMVSASRGCYGNCTFCSVPVFRSDGWRGRDPESVAEEVAMLAGDFGAEFIDFVDDSLFGPRGGVERAAGFRDALAARHVRIPFRASIRPNDVTLDQIRLLKECGLTAVQLGVESLSSRQLVEVYRKGCRPSEALRAIRLLESEGIHVQTGLILFEPSTTLADLQENAECFSEECWAVAKSATSSLYCAEGTRLAAGLLARGESLGLENCLNHRWAFANREVEVVHEALRAYERIHGELGQSLVDAVTPPQLQMDAETSRAVRELQNQHQRLAFRALEMACTEVAAGASVATVLDALRQRLDGEYEAVHQRSTALLQMAPTMGGQG